MNTAARPPWANEEAVCNCGNEDEPRTSNHESTCPAWARFWDSYGDGASGSLQPADHNLWGRHQPLQPESHPVYRSEPTGVSTAGVLIGAALGILTMLAALGIISATRYYLDLQATYEARDDVRIPQSEKVRYQVELAEVTRDGVGFALTHVYEGESAQGVSTASVFCSQLLIRHAETEPVPVGWQCLLPSGAVIYKNLVNGKWSQVAEGWAR